MVQVRGRTYLSTMSIRVCPLTLLLLHQLDSLTLPLLPRMSPPTRRRRRRGKRAKTKWISYRPQPSMKLYLEQGEMHLEQQVLYQSLLIHHLFMYTTLTSILLNPLHHSLEQTLESRPDRGDRREEIQTLVHSLLRIEEAEEED